MVEVHRLKSLIAISLLSFAYIGSLAGCGSPASGASHLAKAEAVIALHSTSATNTPPHILPDTSFSPMRDNTLAAETGARLPGDPPADAPPPLDNSFTVSVAPPAIDLNRNVEDVKLPSLFPKEDLMKQQAQWTPETKPPAVPRVTYINGPFRICSGPNCGQQQQQPPPPPRTGNNNSGGRRGIPLLRRLRRN